MRTVAEPTDLVIVAADGTLRVVGRGAERRLRDRAGRFHLIVDSDELLVLRGEPNTERQGGPRVLMAGEVVTGTTVLEIINVIANASWLGDLRIFSGGNTRSLTFDRGAVKHANSDHPDDRLGEVLYRLGVLSRGELDALLRDVTPERRFGHLLVERGIVDREKLFQYLQKQVESIFHAAVLVRDGTYVFTTPDEHGAPPPTTVHIPAQSLLMEGVQRIDEMALFRERVPHGRMVPQALDGAPEAKLDGDASTVLAYCDGTRTIEDIGRETGLGEFGTTKTVYHLLQAGQVVLHDAPKTSTDADQVRALVAQFNDVMRDVFLAVATYGGVDQTRETLSAWVQGSGYVPFFGEKVEEDGSIDANLVASALANVQAERPLEALQQALHEMAAFALFAATTSMPRAQEIALSRDVNRRLKAIRL
jgi:hypothetical protein